MSGKHTMQYTDDVLLNYTLEIYIILLTNGTPTNLIKNKKELRIQLSRIEPMIYFNIVYSSKPSYRKESNKMSLIKNGIFPIYRKDLLKDVL